jgi:hypothetical protein
MRLISITAICAFVLVPAQAEASAAECPAASSITISGTVHDISTMREEPQAQPETFFKIRLKKPICGKLEVTANTIGPIACSEGQFLEATGKFSPPSKLVGVVRLELAGPVVCKAPK